jgi:hypothetical protein
MNSVEEERNCHQVPFREAPLTPGNSVRPDRTVNLSKKRILMSVDPSERKGHHPQTVPYVRSSGGFHLPGRPVKGSSASVTLQTHKFECAHFPDSSWFAKSGNGGKPSPACAEALAGFRVHGPKEVRRQLDNLSFRLHVFQRNDLGALLCGPSGRDSHQRKGSRVPFPGDSGFRVIQATVWTDLQIQVKKSPKDPLRPEPSQIGQRNQN